MPQSLTRQNFDLLFDALNSMEEALVVYDESGQLRACNQAFLQMYNYTAEQARPGVHFRELGEIDIRNGNVVVEGEEGEKYLERKAAYRKSLKGSFIVKLRDGRWIRTTDRAMPDGGFVSVHVDISELKLAQEKVLAAHQREMARHNENIEEEFAERTQELVVAKVTAERQARTDALSGLKNRRAFFEAANLIFETSIRFEHIFSAIMIDIDQFKEVNDNYGHLFGDQVIRALANTVVKEIRGVDVSGRIGGDEFAIILPETSAENVLVMAERLRHSFSSQSIRYEEIALNFSISIGVAELEAGDKRVEDALARADKALYRAKAKGKNQVVRG